MCILSCKNDDIENIDNLKTKKVITINNNDSIYEITPNDSIKEVVNWRCTENGENIFTTDVLLDYSEISDIKLKGAKDGSFEVKIEDNIFYIKDISFKDNCIYYNVDFGDKVMNISTSNCSIDEYNLLLNTFNTGLLENPLSKHIKNKKYGQIIIPVAIAVATILHTAGIAMITLYVTEKQRQCDNDIAAGIQNCAIKKCESKVDNTNCKVTCFNCKN